VLQRGIGPAWPARIPGKDKSERHPEGLGFAQTHLSTWGEESERQACQCRHRDVGDGLAWMEDMAGVGVESWEEEVEELGGGGDGGWEGGERNAIAAEYMPEWRGGRGAPVRGREEGRRVGGGVDGVRVKCKLMGKCNVE
jgi:hypothetical protein